MDTIRNASVTHFNTLKSCTYVSNKQPDLNRYIFQPNVRTTCCWKTESSDGLCCGCSSTDPNTFGRIAAGLIKIDLRLTPEPPGARRFQGETLRTIIRKDKYTDIIVDGVFFANVDLIFQTFFERRESYRKLFSWLGKYDSLLFINVIPL